MKVCTNENVRPFDIDGCLIVSADQSSLKANVLDPVTGKTIKVGVNRAMVRLLKEEFQRGSFILVWSRSGYQWAKNVVIALELEQYVGQVCQNQLSISMTLLLRNGLKTAYLLAPT